MCLSKINSLYWLWCTPAHCVDSNFLAHQLALLGIPQGPETNGTLAFTFSHYFLVLSYHSFCSSTATAPLGSISKVSLKRDQHVLKVTLPFMTS